MRREAAASAVTGGAASVQVARLVRECEQRARQRVTEPLCRVRACPLGVDAVLGDAAHLCAASHGSPADERPLPLCTRKESSAAAAPRQRSSTRDRSSGDSSAQPRFPPVQDRHIVQVGHGADTFRFVVPTAPAWVHDQHGQQWHLAKCGDDYTPEGMWRNRLTALGSAGMIASVNFLVYRHVHPVVAKIIRDAPVGPMSDALRSAVPVFGSTAEQMTASSFLTSKRQRMTHPNVLALLGHSHSVEGVLLLLWEFSPGGTLRQVSARYREIKPATILRFSLQILSALCWLHERGIAHGKLSLDNVMIDSDGRCRLTGHSPELAVSLRTFQLPRTCYISPLMATGALPTPACDMFCYGLMILELGTRLPPWRWTIGTDGQPQGTAEQLKELMSEGGQPFSDAVVQGRVVVHTELLDLPIVVGRFNPESISSIRCCLSDDPNTRLTASQFRDYVKGLGYELGMKYEDDDTDDESP
ncbi:Protein tyrosine kinase/Protein kinase domain containing protein [Novymonas esmeraldas]|uniref:Protein tyrosine kinase/Protein kinase domain containing protein n=1 Tax=Novymonas esmeraldas TaxID=1808958 RepID=A0AAW0EZ47_9TRYP